RQHRAKYFFPGDLHCRFCLQDRWRKEQAGTRSLILVRRSAGAYPSAFAAADFDILLDPVQRLAVYQRSHVYARDRARSYFYGVCPIDDPADKLIVDAFADDRPACSGASLTRRAKSARDYAVKSQIEVSIVKDDLGVLASQLELDFQQTIGRRPRDRLSDFCRPGERDAADARIVDDLDCGFAVTMNEVHDPRRQADFREAADECGGSHRSERRRL